MVDISTLSPGMRVKIVDEWNSYCQQNRDGEMDHHLGTVVTVAEIHGSYILIEEDAGEYDGSHWYWNAHCLEYVVDEPSTEIETANDDELFLFLFDRSTQEKGGAT